MGLAPFTRHPASVGESYGRHLCAASGFGGRMVLAGLACLLHGVFPFLFPTVGSRTIAQLNEAMVRNRRRHAPIGQPAADGHPLAGPSGAG